MTDVQQWVDVEGRLTDSIDIENAIDLSTQMNPVSMLHQKMNFFKFSDTRRVKYLSMAKCWLSRIPPVFRITDPSGRWLSDTVEFMTFYGNFFVEVDLPGEHYYVSMNASGAREAEFVSTYQPAQMTSVWSTGLQVTVFPNLRELDLRACSIRVLSTNLFQGMQKLEALYLGENLVHFIDADVFSGLQNLIHLDFSRNEAYDEVGNQKNIEMPRNVFKGLRNLTSLDLSFTRLSQRNVVVLRGLGPSLRRLSLCYTGISAMRGGIFSGTSLKILDISYNNGLIKEAGIFRGIEQSLQVLYAIDVGLRSLEYLRGLRHLEVLQLSRNEIGFVPIETARTWENLKILDLNKNRLTSWFTPTYSLMPNLIFLQLKDNNINVISEEMILDLSHLNFLAMSGNFIVCNCHARDFIELAARNEDRSRNISLYSNVNNGTGNFSFHRAFIDHNNILRERYPINSDCNECVEELKIHANFVLTDYSRSNYMCVSVTNSESVTFKDVIGCNSLRDIDYEQIMAGGRNKLLALLVIPCVLLPLFVMFVFRRNLRYCMITLRNSTLLSLINKKEVVDVDGTIFHYDVFVSYCNEDRGWVLDHLLPHLESDCSISACLHERDFQVGLSILENIVSCMDRSRSIMLIISQKFLMSQWCQFEMHLAQHRLLETRREDLTLVLLEEIPRRLRPTTLHYLMLTKTYIVWPAADAERALFWKRLRKSLVTQKLKQPEGVSLA
ncbi:hypothetical protein O3G_MSEX008775 [Manduca sexta]|nr:hypothetical protein O3G_MSEX008775 [Manduca sexta]